MLFHGLAMKHSRFTVSFEVVEVALKLRLGWSQIAQRTKEGTAARMFTTPLGLGARSSAVKSTKRVRAVCSSQPWHQDYLTYGSVAASLRFTKADRRSPTIGSWFMEDATEGGVARCWKL